MNYLVKVSVQKRDYTIFGYKGKQVRDQIHSYDVVNAFWHFAQNPRPGEVYNLGGGKENAASLMESIVLIEKECGSRPNTSYSETNRTGDHICYYTDLSKLKSHFPEWKLKYDLNDIVSQMVAAEVKAIS